MIITASQNISHSAQQVFIAVRDRQSELVEFMPNIESCTVVERKENPPRVELLNRWQAALRDLPAVLRSVVKPDLVAWMDRATWDEQTLSCNWELTSIGAKDIFACHGTTTIVALDDKQCTFTVRGDLAIHADKLPGVPRLLARTIRDPLERFIAAALRPNLTGIASAVQRYLDSKGK